jgi:hypothetical protein
MNDFEKDAKDFGLNDNRVTEESIAKKIVKEEYLYHEGGTLTICILTLQNGFTVRGESACADPANFRAELGRKYSKADAVKKVWPLEGYLLKQALYIQNQIQ